MHPFKAVYAYTPSKLLSSYAARLKSGPTEEVDEGWETVVKPTTSFLLSDSDAGSNDASSVDNLGLASSIGERSPVSGNEGIGTIVVYGRQFDPNGSALLNHDVASDPRYFNQSGMRRSCSLDGVALASRCHGDSDVICQYRSGSVVSNTSSEDDRHSQGQTGLMFEH